MDKQTKHATSKDVAKLANVSQSTVSRVFNQKDVNNTTREKVLNAANQLGYIPNILARGLVTNKTNMIAVITAEGFGPFYLKMTHTLVKLLQENGLQPIFFSLSENEEMSNVMDRIMQYQVDAVILTPSMLSLEMGLKCLESNIPSMLLNDYDKEQRISSVSIDHFKGGELVGELFLKQGYRNIAYVGYAKPALDILERKKGFLNKISKVHVNIINKECENTYEEGYEIGLSLIRQDIEAIFCVNDLVTVGIIDAIRNNDNISLSKNIDIVGYDSIVQSSWKVYNFTTVNQPIDELILKTISVLINLIESNTQEVINLKIQPTLVLR
ncbi:MAG: hypothetical protein ATN32_04645 [Candidatus Epulonipiscium fishelsonii]|nr:MAG: hypothetical protein ATN32_04645 [Epulopiscium sp. AS2M-Bin002]